MPPPSFDNSPIVGYFNDQESAEKCLRKLRASGLSNEQIGVTYPGEVVISPANYPGVGRATDQLHSTSEIDLDAHIDSETEGLPGQPTPNTEKFDPEWEAKEYQRPAKGVVISVAAEPNQREQVRELLFHYGAQLADWRPEAA
jgi:hypothetical protein